MVVSIRILDPGRTRRCTCAPGTRGAGEHPSAGQRAPELDPIRPVDACPTGRQQIECTATVVRDAVGRNDDGSIVFVANAEIADRVSVRIRMARRYEDGATVREDEMDDLMAGRHRRRPDLVDDGSNLPS